MRQQEAELENAIQDDFIRLTHGKRSADFIRDSFGADNRLNVAAVNLAGAVALVCHSHVWAAEDLTPEKGFHQQFPLKVKGSSIPGETESSGASVS
jgi:hypothetical protein